MGSLDWLLISCNVGHPSEYPPLPLDVTAAIILLLAALGVNSRSQRSTDTPAGITCRAVVSVFTCTESRRVYFALFTLTQRSSFSRRKTDFSLFLRVSQCERVKIKRLLTFLLRVTNMKLQPAAG